MLATVFYNNRECWVAQDVAIAAGVTDHIIKNSDLEEGIDYEVLRGSNLAYFKSLLNSVGCQPTEDYAVAYNRAAHITIFYEPGFMLLRLNTHQRLM